jgi:hypothetical protein
LGEKTSGPSFATAPFRNKRSLEKNEEKNMFQGTTIDELISSVERAEEHARQQRQDDPMALSFRQVPLQRTEWQELIEVA